jgi:hypothetical protein
MSVPDFPVVSVSFLPLIFPDSAVPDARQNFNNLRLATRKAMASWQQGTRRKKAKKAPVDLQHPARGDGNMERESVGF